MKGAPDTLNHRHLRQDLVRWAALARPDRAVLLEIDVFGPRRSAPPPHPALTPGLPPPQGGLFAEPPGSLIDEIGFAATATLYAATGLALMVAIGLHWRADLWHVHAPANPR
jgi:hypothetical protein